MRAGKNEVDLNLIDRDVVSELSKLKETIAMLDQDIDEREREAEYVEEDLKKLRERLKEVDSSLQENLAKFTRCEENNKEIVTFYEKLVENSKSLNTFINRQNAILEASDQ